jgi:hypothetical protein
MTNTNVCLCFTGCGVSDLSMNLGVATSGICLHVSLPSEAQRKPTFAKSGIGRAIMPRSFPTPSTKAATIAMSQTATREILTGGCSGCGLATPCGGLGKSADLFGCFDRCRSRRTTLRVDSRGRPFVGAVSRTVPHCANGDCDWTCPNNPDVFAARWAEVGGLLDFSHEPYLRLDGSTWPCYIPMIRSGPCRRTPLNCSFVALSLYESLRVLRAGNGRYEPTGAVNFRRRLALRDDCKILLVGVGPDATIEGFYRKYRQLDLPRIFAGLGLTAITPPNFSYFLDVPRPHSLYNRKRMLRVADEFLREGVPVAPHFNATNEADWDFWIDLLRQSPGLSVYCKEFQTGNQFRRCYAGTVEQMLRVQDRIGRPLHALLVAGKKTLPGLLPGLQSRQGSFSVIDSDPSMKTNHRQILGDDGSKSITAVAGACLSRLLDHNITVQRRLVDQRVAQAISAQALVFSQSEDLKRRAPAKMPVLELERYALLTSQSRNGSPRQPQA